MKLYVFDPGITTGYAIMPCTAEGITLLGTREIGNDARLFIAVAQRDMQHCDYDDIIVAEKFYLYPGKRGALTLNDMPAAIALGRIEVLAALAGLKMHTQNAATMKPFASPDIMARKLDLPNVSYLPISEHCRDALRHGLAYYYSRARPQLKAIAAKAEAASTPPVEAGNG